MTLLARLNLVAWVLLFNLVSHSQTTDKTKSGTTNLPQEKIHVHFDKDNYYPGETVWFKTYLFANGLPSTISNIMYADLIAADGKILEHQLLPVAFASSSGSIVIPAKATGNVTLRCYTKWMLNFDAGTLYEKQLLLPANETDKFVAKPAPNTYKIQFFPESGQLVENVESRTVIMIKDQFNRPASLAGIIKNSFDQQVVPFETNKNGVALVTLLPEPGAVYWAMYKPGADSVKVELPASVKSGVVLELSNSKKDNIVYTIKTSDTKPTYATLFLTASVRNQIIYKVKMPAQQFLVTSGMMKIKDVPPGIVRFQIKNEQEQTLAERSTFVNAENVSIPISITQSVVDKGSKKKNSLDILVTDTILANLSVSVSIDNQQVSRADQSIFSNLLLNGNDQFPYHTDATSSADSANWFLDVLMMAKGVESKELQKEIKYQPEKSIAVKGKMKGLTDKELQGRNLSGVLLLSNGRKHFLSTPISADKTFAFEQLNIYDSAKLYYQFGDDKKGALISKAEFNSTVESLETAPKLPLRISSPVYAQNALPTDTSSYTMARVMKIAEESENVTTLDQVTVKGKIKTRKEILNEEYTSGAFESSGQARIIDPADDPAFLSSLTLLDYLQGRYPGIMVNPSSDANAISWRGQTTSLFVDEISQYKDLGDGPFEDAGYIKSLTMSEIAMVKIFNPPFVGAWGGGPGGAIAVYLKKAGASFTDTPKDFVKIKGFTTPKQFEIRDYSEALNNPIQDYRTTLFWNPYVITEGKNNTVNCTFYTSDVKGTIRIVVEGINLDGKIVRYEKVL